MKRYQTEIKQKINQRTENSVVGFASNKEQTRQCLKYYNHWYIRFIWKSQETTWNVERKDREMKIKTRGKTGHGSQRRVSVNDKPESVNEREASHSKLFQCSVCHVL